MLNSLMYVYTIIFIHIPHKLMMSPKVRYIRLNKINIPSARVKSNK